MHTAGILPTQWKIARVVLVPKPGKSKRDLGGYRPISLLPIMGKIFERCLLGHISAFLNKNCSIIEEQFGFRSGHFTINQLVRVAQMVTHEVNVNRYAAMALLDLSKAFDSVWHRALLYKLIKMG